MILKLASALQTGSRHLRSGLPCQDSITLRQNETGVFAVLADGAGSVPHSELISHAVTNAVCITLSERFDELWGMEDISLRSAILRSALEAVRNELPDMEADCTLVAAALARDGRALLLHLGDGAILTLDEDGKGQVFSRPENGEKPGSTFFVAGPEPMRHLRICRELPDQTQLVLLSSDGAADMLYYEPEGTVAAAVPIMAEWLESDDGETVSHMLEEELGRIFQKGTEDDMSVVLLLRQWEQDALSPPAAEGQPEDDTELAEREGKVPISSPEPQNAEERPDKPSLLRKIFSVFR